MKNPKTVAGLALFLSLNDNLDDKKEFHSMFCNKNTLKNAFEEVKPFLKIIVPQEYIDRVSN